MKINLLPQEFRPQPLVSPIRLLVMIVGLVLIFISFAAMGFQYFQLSQEKEQLRNLQTQLELQQEQLAEANKIEEIYNEVKKRQETVKKILDSYPRYHLLLSEMASTLKPDIWLTEVQFNQDGFLEIRGEAILFPVIGDFLKNLIRTEDYKTARLLKVSEREILDSEPVYSFEIEVSTGEGAPEYATKN